MSVEETKPTEEVVVETTTDEVVEKPTEEVSDVSIKDDLVTFKLWGEEIEIPFTKAQKLVAERKTKTQAFVELETKVKQYEGEKADLARKLQAAEAAKNGNLQEAEELFNAKLEQITSKYKNKIVKGELERNLSAHPEFLGRDVLEDAIKLISADNKFDLGDDDLVRAGAKTITEIVSEFIATKPAFRKAGKPSNQQDARPAGKKVEGEINMGQALAKWLANK